MAGVERWIGNPVSRAFLQFVVSHDECGDRLSNGIDYYLRRKKPLCWKCRLAGNVVGHTFRKGSFLFGVNNKDFRRSLENPVFKRGIMNVLNGIARDGVTRPQMINAPFLVVWDFTHKCNLQCKHCYRTPSRPFRMNWVPRRPRPDPGTGRRGCRRHRIFRGRASHEKRFFRDRRLCPSLRYVCSTGEQRDADHPGGCRQA